MNIFEKKVTLIANVFPKLRRQKKLVRSMPKKSSFKGSFGKQQGKRAQRLLKFAWQHLYQIYWSLWRQLSCKKSLLVICKLSRLFPNSLSAYGKYSLFNRDNLSQPIQMQLSRKQKTFSELFSAFSKSRLKFKDPLKLEFLGIDLTRFFCVRNFGNTSAIRVIFF